MKIRRHGFAATICLVLVLFVLVSSAWIVHETTHHHDCTGTGCPICQFIAQLEQLRQGFGLVLMALLALFAAPAAGRSGCRGSPRRRPVRP